PDQQKRLRNQCVLAKGYLNGVKQFDDEQNQQNPIKQLDIMGLPGGNVLYIVNDTGYQECKRTAGEEQSETDVDDIFNPGEGASDPYAGLRSWRFGWTHKPVPFHNCPQIPSGRA